MNRIAFTHKTRLLLTAGAFVFAFSPAAQAQTAGETAQLMQRLNELQNQVTTLSRAVYRGDKDAAAALATGEAAASAAGNEERMSAIEEQQRKLTGQIEKIGFDVDQLKTRLEKMQADNDQRFAQLERAAPAPAAESNTTLTPAPAAPASGTLGTIGNGPAETLYEEAFAAVRDSKYDESETKFKQFLSQHPTHPLAANAQYWLGETYYVRGNYKEAARTFAQGYQSYPKSGKAQDSLYKLALSLKKLDKKDDACVALRQLEKDFPADTGPLHIKSQNELKELACP